MADDTIKSLNLLSSLKSAASDLRREFSQLRQEAGGFNNVLGSANARMNNWASSRWDQRTGGSSNQVAPYPVFSVNAQGETTRDYRDGNRVFAGAVEPYRPYPQIYTGGPIAPTPPMDGGRGLTPFQQRTMAAGAAAGLSLMPGVREAVEYELGTSRMVFFQQQAGFTGGRRESFGFGKVNPFGTAFPGTPGPGSDYATATALLQELGRTGTVTGKFDTLKAMEVARQYGINSPNFSQVALGAAEMSNITPGIGVEGSMRAYGAMQQARNVNMLRGIGIRIRGEDGSLKPMPQIIDEIWNKLNREKMGTEPITVQDVTMSLQPGNALASMLDQYFGNDPMLRKQVEDGLILKARSGGATFGGGGLKKLAEKYGATTPAVSSLSQRIDEKTKTLQQIAPAMSDAFTFANRIFSYMNGFLNLIDRFVGLFKLGGFAGAGGSTLFGGPTATGLFAGIAAGVGGFFRNIFRAEGGPVENKMPYIVGERGPELFVPKTDGDIVPNHELKNFPFRGDGGPVSAKKDWTADEWATKLAQRLGAPKPSADAIDALKTWMRFEGGHWKNDADYNPLNTTLTLKGSKSMNPIGVKAYTSWEQGLDATVQTLTGNKADARGYTAIVEAIKNGNRLEILNAVNNSAWRTGEAGGAGRYKHMLGSKGGDYGSSREGGDFSGSSSSGASAFEPGERFSMSKFLAGAENSNRNIMAQFLKGFTSMSKPERLTAAQQGSTTYNYGGVTVNLTGAGSPEATVAALQAALQNTQLLAQTARS